MDGMPVVQPVEVPSLAPPPPLDVSESGTHIPCPSSVYPRRMNERKRVVSCTLRLQM